MPSLLVHNVTLQVHSVRMTEACQTHCLVPKKRRIRSEERQLRAWNQSLRFHAGLKPLHADGTIVLVDIRSHRARTQKKHRLRTIRHHDALIRLDAATDRRLVALEVAQEEGKVGKESVTPEIRLVVADAVARVRVQHPVAIYDGDVSETDVRHRLHARHRCGTLAEGGLRLSQRLERVARVRERVGYDDRGRRHQPVDAVCEVGGGNGPEGGVACQNTGETPSHGRVLDAQIENEAVQQTVHLARPRHSLVWSEIVWK